MKALSIYQPHASLIVDKHKRFETRSWCVKYRGQELLEVPDEEIERYEAEGS